MKKTILTTAILLATSLPAVAESNTIAATEITSLDRAGWLNFPPAKPKRGAFIPTLPPAKPKRGAFIPTLPPAKPK